MRKTRNTLCILFAIAILSLCCSCGLFGDQQYVCEADEVKAIQIVRLDAYVEGEYRFEYTILSEVIDCASFVDRLNAINHSVNWGDPQPLRVGYVVIKIDYHNGDFDLLHQDAQWLHRSGANNTGYFFFNEEQFTTLIYDYLS